MIDNKVLGLIGLAMKAGKISFGADSVEENIIKKKVKLVILSKIVLIEQKTNLLI